MKLFIVHFNPLELYPPTLNFISYFVENKSTQDTIQIRSTKDVNIQRNIEVFKKNNICIKRTKSSLINDFLVVKLYKYICFNLYTIIDLIKFRPSTIIYYETLSCFPSIFYKKWINTKSKLIVHYHEYTSIHEYQNTSFYTHFLWKFEKNNFNFIDVISHTNSLRLQLFQNDYPTINFKKLFTLPNYPSKNWYTVAQSNRALKKKTTRLVYVGALSFDFYIKEICEWLIEHKIEVSLDIYSNNLDQLTKDYLLGLNSNRIIIKQSVNYHDLPKVIKNYDIGLILYKGCIPNQVFLAPNKLFEYLALGLDVWFPTELKGSYEFINRKVAPLVIDTNFSDKKSIDNSYSLFKEITCISSKRRDIKFYSEDIYKLLFEEIN